MTSFWIITIFIASNKVKFSTTDRDFIGYQTRGGVADLPSLKTDILRHWCDIMDNGVGSSRIWSGTDLATDILYDNRAAQHLRFVFEHRLVPLSAI
jgi:hypothetical protein